MNPQKTECPLYLRYDAYVCLRLQKGKYSLSDAMDGLDTEEGTMNIPCVAFLERPCFHFSVL
jgi:hypothetical protein